MRDAVRSSGQPHSTRLRIRQRLRKSERCSVLGDQLLRARSAAPASAACCARCRGGARRARGCRRCRGAPRRARCARRGSRSIGARVPTRRRTGGGLVEAADRDRGLRHARRRARRPSARSSARSRACSSSRTLPGQAWRASASRNSGVDARERRRRGAAPAPGSSRAHEQRDVAGALAERRQLDREDAEAELEVRAEAARAHRRARGRGASRRRRARRARGVRVPPRRSKRRSWSARSSLPWSGELELADLVEEERAAARELEAADARRDGAGEGAALVAEELALDEARRERRAVDVHEGPARARASAAWSSRAARPFPVPVSPRSSTRALGGRDAGELAAHAGHRLGAPARRLGSGRTTISPRATAGDESNSRAGDRACGGARGPAAARRASVRPGSPRGARGRRDTRRCRGRALAPWWRAGSQRRPTPPGRGYAGSTQAPRSRISSTRRSAASASATWRSTQLLADVEVHLADARADVAEVRVGHLAGAVHDAAHHRDLEALAGARCAP